MKSTLTVAFLTSKDPKDRKAWSGIYFQMLRALELHFSNVVPLGPVKLNKFLAIITKVIDLANRKIFPRSYDIFHSKLHAKYYAPLFEKKILDAKCDIVFAPASSVEIALLKTNTPIVYYSDSSFSQLKGYYNNFSNILAFSEREAELIQRDALLNSNIVIHSSEWASDYVIQHYKVEKAKAFTVAMGANIDNAPDIEIIKQKLNNKTTCNLLFLGVDWERKGGEIAYNTLVELKRLGFNAHLTICGCVPPAKFTHPNITVIPFLNKNKEADYKHFIELLTNSHFLLLPTRAECAGIVYAEASAYGIPSITTATGGVASMVEDNVNGYKLSMDADGPEYAALIKDIFSDTDKYEKLVYSSRKKFDNQLNWNSWADQIKKIVSERYQKN